MIIEEILLVSVVALTFALVFSRYGYASIIGLTTLGFFVYTIPAIIGVMTTPFSSGRFIESTSAAGTMVMVVAWSVYLLLLTLNSVGSGRDRLVSKDIAQDRYPEMQVFLVILIILSAILYFLISYNSGPLFFLERQIEEITITEQSLLLWRWVNAIGFISATILKKPAMAAYFAVFVIVYFIRGDRTILIITAGAMLPILLEKVPLRKAPFQLRTIILAVIALTVVFFGKAAYTAIKIGEVYPLTTALSPTGNSQFIASFEPFLIHGHLETVMNSGFRYSIRDVFEGVAGQFLIVPSIFGIDSSKFNIVFTDAHYRGLDYGLAYSYWAQAFSVAGIAGIVLFAATFALIAIGCDFLYRNGRLITKISALVIGATIGIYLYRNSLENIAVFVRQILMVILPAYILAFVIAKGRGSSSIKAHV